MNTLIIGLSNTYKSGMAISGLLVDDLTFDFDNYDYGIDTIVDQSVTFVELDSGPICLKSNEILNPFFVGVKGGSLSSKNDKEIYGKYRRALVLCMHDSYDTSKNLDIFFNKIVDRQQLYDLGSQFVLLPCSMNLLSNWNFKNISNIVDREHLEQMFSTKSITFDNNEIVIPMLELTESMVRINLSLYDKPYGLSDLGKFNDLISYYNRNFKKPIINQYIKYISDLQENQFWKNPMNCQSVNMTKMFEFRSFCSSFPNVKMIYSNNKSKIVDNVNKSKKISPVDDPQETLVSFDKCLANSGKRKYYIPDINNLKLSKSDITQMICSIDNEQELYHTFNCFLVSKDYCHLVLNNLDVLTKVQPLFEKYAPIYKVLIGYAWASFWIEENIMGVKVTKNFRHVFDINTANKLPSFPFTFEDLTQNPYLSLLINKDTMNIQNNCLGLYCLQDLSGYGICTLNQFKSRLNALLSGNSHIDMFNGLDWTHYAISGSTISACLQKRPPLMHTIIDQGSEEKNWIAYFKQYYGDSDVDIICNDPSIFGFNEKVSDLVKVLSNNLKCGLSDFKIDPIKSLCVVLYPESFTEIADDFNKKTGFTHTAQDLKDKFSSEISEDLKDYLYVHLYLIKKLQMNASIRSEKRDTNECIKEFMKMTDKSNINIKLFTETFGENKHDKTIHDSEICFHINDFRDSEHKVPDDQNKIIIKIFDGIRFKISSKHMTKTIEIFNTKEQEFFSIVARFHFPCVRAYYQNNNVYMLPSCITSMMTGVNIDYRYFASTNKDPTDIINKYRNRGFGVILTKEELNHVFNYNTDPATNESSVFYLTREQIDSHVKMFGPKDMNDKIFRPLSYIQGNSKDIIKETTNVEYIKSLDDLKQFYKTKYNYDSSKSVFDLFKFKPITDDGCITPYKPWLESEYFDMMRTPSESKPIQQIKIKKNKFRKNVSDKKV